MNIKEFKKKFNLSDKEISSAFGYKNAHSYRTSSARSAIDNGIEFILSKFSE
jgi:hypothetical protein